MWASSSSGEDGLGLSGSFTIPILRVDVVSHDTIAEGFKGRDSVAAGDQIWWTHVSGLDAKYVGKCCFQPCHLGGNGSRRQRAQRSMVPGMGSDLVASVIGSFEGGSAVINAAIESTSHEECGLRTGSVESRHQGVFI